MRCRACEIELDADDNYCRRCGAPARVLDVTITHRAPAVRVGPSTAAIVAGAARPIATGAAAVAATALVRFALRRMLRRAVGEAIKARPTAPSKALTTRAAPPARPAAPSVHVTEILWYRRIVRS